MGKTITCFLLCLHFPFSFFNTFLPTNSSRDCLYLNIGSMVAFLVQFFVFSKDSIHRKNFLFACILASPLCLQSLLGIKINILFFSFYKHSFFSFSFVQFIHFTIFSASNFMTNYVFCTHCLHKSFFLFIFRCASFCYGLFLYKVYVIDDFIN